MGPENTFIPNLIAVLCACAIAVIIYSYWNFRKTFNENLLAPLVFGVTMASVIGLLAYRINRIVFIVLAKIEYSSEIQDLELLHYVLGKYYRVSILIEVVLPLILIIAFVLYLIFMKHHRKSKQ